jgi:hypothetical protein
MLIITIEVAAVVDAKDRQGIVTKMNLSITTTIIIGEMVVAAAGILLPSMEITFATILMIVIVVVVVGVVILFLIELEMDLIIIIILVTVPHRGREIFEEEEEVDRILHTEVTAAAVLLGISLHREDEDPMNDEDVDRNDI